MLHGTDLFFLLVNHYNYLIKLIEYFRMNVISKQRELGSSRRTDTLNRKKKPESRNQDKNRGKRKVKHSSVLTAIKLFFCKAVFEL